MTNKEKYLQKIAGQESKAVQQATWRNANREWLRESQKLAMTILMELGKKEMTQKDLAEMIGKTPQYVNKLLRGNEKFGFEILVKIQNALKFGLLTTFEPKQNSQKLVFEETQEIERGTSKINYTGSCKVIKMKPILVEKEEYTYNQLILEG